MDAQTAALFGQQSSQPAGFPGGGQKTGSNEDLALALAAMASSPSMQNAVLGGGLTDTNGTGLQTAMMGGFTPPSQEGSVSSIFGNINTGVNAVKTGAGLWEAGSNLYNSIMGPDWAGIADAGAAITAGNLAADTMATIPATDIYDWWTWAV